MFCAKCGTENVEGARFCKECGQPLAPAESEQPLAPAESEQPVVSAESEQPEVVTPSNDASSAKADEKPVQESKEASGKSAEKAKSTPVKLLIGVVAAIVALIVIICVAVNAGSTISLDKYMTVEATGYDGYGTATVSIDWDAIEEKYGSKLSFSNAAKKEYGVLLDFITPVDVIRDSVDVRLEENTGLSNGAEVSYKWVIDEELSKYVKCKLKYKDDKFTVAGLIKVDSFDAFADLTVEFLGVAPNGTVNLNYTGSDMNYSDFRCDQTSGLSNGDKVVVTIDESKREYYAERIGKVPETLEKEYTVEGLNSYLALISEIDDEALAAMQAQASDVFNAHVAQKWGEGEELQSFTYIGDYLLTVKNKGAMSGHNYLFLVYKAQVHNSYSNDGEVYDKVNDLYWYIGFDELILGPDGKIDIDVTRYNTPNSQFTVDTGISAGWWSTKSWYYYGYEKLDELYKEVVTSKLDNYNHEDNVDESVAPETVAVVEEETVAAENGYILANSDTELITKEDLEGLSAQDCKLARNEIYARHGRKFDDEELQSYFEACDWYEGTIEPADFDESILSETETANRDLIVAYEEEQGYR